MRRLYLSAFALIVSTAAAYATPITGTYSVTSSGSPTITNIFSSPFSMDLVLGTPQTFNLAKLIEHFDGTTNITAAFNFTLPGSGVAAIQGTDVFSTPGNSAHDSLVWGSGGLAVMNFSNGAVLDVTMAGDVYDGNSDRYAGLTPTVTFNLITAPNNNQVTIVPEPMTISIFSAGLIGAAAAIRRRRRTAKA